jgi:GNAT superfamily N-acetyltransferase
MGLLPAYRGRGIGRALIEAIRGWVPMWGTMHRTGSTDGNAPHCVMRISVRRLCDMNAVRLLRRQAAIFRAHGLVATIATQSQEGAAV